MNSFLIRLIAAMYINNVNTSKENIEIKLKKLINSTNNDKFSFNFIITSVEINNENQNSLLENNLKGLIFDFFIKHL